VAIAGPNNVGKSSLFNSLVKKPLSPARAEGGLTKQCLASAHPKLWADEDARSLLTRRYDVVLTGEAPPPVDTPGPPGRLYLALSEDAPPGLLVMDTPDFDSIYRQNRENAEALLVTVDVVVFVVSRQTYQNAALVDFLKDAVGHGRPYLLIYNEASREEIARAHLDKLAQDVGKPPLARYAALHQPDVESGLAFLRTEPLDNAPPLATLLSEPGHAAQLKRQALEASLAEARNELELIAQAVAAEAVEPERLRARLRHELSEVGAQAALKGVPADILIEAFRDELDARSHFHRWVRLPFRGLATALTFVGRKLHESFTGPKPTRDEVGALTEDALKDGVRRTVEALAPEVTAWRGDAATRQRLEEALGPQTLDKLVGPWGLPEVRNSTEDRARLYDFCRGLIGQELEKGGDQETALQALTTLVYSVPAGAAAVVTAATGGLGQDAALWAGTLLSTPLLEKFVDLLGAQLRSRVTKTWAESHGATLARALERKLFSPLLEGLDLTTETAHRRAEALREARSRLT